MSAQSASQNKAVYVVGVRCKDATSTYRSSMLLVGNRRGQRLRHSASKLRRANRSKHHSAPNPEEGNADAMCCENSANCWFINAEAPGSFMITAGTLPPWTAGTGGS